MGLSLHLFQLFELFEGISDIFIIFFFSKTFRLVDDDETFTPSVSVVDARVEGTRLNLYLAKPFQSKRLLTNDSKLKMILTGKTEN